jgi:hypothetical protein
MNFQKKKSRNTSIKLSEEVFYENNYDSSGLREGDPILAFYAAAGEAKEGFYESEIAGIFSDAEQALKFIRSKRTSQARKTTSVSSLRLLD